MPNLKIYLTISILLNVIFLYLILKPTPTKSDMETYLLNKVKTDNIIKKQKLKADSSIFVNHINELAVKVSKIQKQRKHERSLYERELSKLKSINSDSSYTYILDSIKKVCCPNYSR